MGSIYRNGDGWAIRYDLPNVKGERKQKYESGFQTRPIAAAELKKREADVLRGKLFFGNDITLPDFIDNWTKRYVSNLAPKTIRFYKSLCDNYIKPYFINTKLSALRGDAIEGFYSYLKNNTELSPNSIHHIHKTLRACLNKAVRWGYLTSSPMLNTEPPKRTKTTIKFWQPDEIKEALLLFENTPIKWHVNFALYTGLRLGEVCALKEDCIDFKNRTFKVKETAQRVKGKGIVFKEPKTEESKAEMPLTPECARLLKEKMLENRNNRISNARFYNKDHIGYLSVWEDGHLVDPDYISKAFTDIIKAQDKIPQITFHGLRHSCASWLLYNGSDLMTIQKLLRHASYTITVDTYSHILMDKMREALEGLQ